MTGTLDTAATRSQLAAIREYLLEYGEIDKRTALNICDCDRLGAGIWDIRHDPDDPMSIRTEWRMKKNRFGHVTRYAIYVLEREDA